MKRFFNTLLLFRLFLIFAAGLLFSGIAGADDLAPPPWDRLGAANYSTSAEWEFIASGPTPYVADGVEVPLIIGDGGGGFTPDMLPDDDIGWVVGDGDGGWLGGAGGIGIGTLNFRIANWIDTEPLKILRIQMTYERGPAALSPYVDEIIPFDPLGIDSIALVDVVDAAIPLDPDGRWHRVETWEIEPNPDFESVKVIVPEGVLVDQVVVDTISTVPEPTSVLLLAMGGWVLIRRRQ